jgi:GNAT superfamily N-acetyltransferase
MSELTYSAERNITAAQFIDVLNRSTLGERRPVHDAQRIAAMLEHANLICTAWSGDLLVGVARSVTDFAFCCYLSDLAVDAAFQGKGVGTELIRMTQRRLHPDAKLILLAAPKAREYYPRIGMEPHDSAWVASASKVLERAGSNS